MVTATPVWMTTLLPVFCTTVRIPAASVKAPLAMVLVARTSPVPK